MPKCRKNCVCVCASAEVTLPVNLLSCSQTVDIDITRACSAGNVMPLHKHKINIAFVLGSLPCLHYICLFSSPIEAKAHVYTNFLQRDMRACASENTLDSLPSCAAPLRPSAGARLSFRSPPPAIFSSSMPLFVPHLPCWPFPIHFLSLSVTSLLTCVIHHLSPLPSPLSLSSLYSLLLCFPSQYSLLPLLPLCTTYTFSVIDRFIKTCVCFKRFLHI